jgi:hypothetical protein
MASSDPMLFSRLDLRRFAGLALAAGVGLAGCRPAEQITKYTVPKPELIDPTLTAAAEGVRQQILGVMVQTGETSWFFKITGDPAVVQPSSAAFRTFLGSVKFPAGDAPPTWTLPEGWQQLPSDGVRFATLRFQSGEQPVDVSVMPAGGDVLANVNRWREQVGQPPITASELSKETESFEVDGREATLVSVVGAKTERGMGGAPFAPFAGGSSPPALPPSGPPAASGLDFEVPKEWRPAPGTGISAAAFQVAEGGKKVVITVTPVGGDWLSNVNRWRDQVHLPPLTLDEVAKATQKISTFGTTGDYIEAAGPGDVTPPQTILGVHAIANGEPWFIKLQGDGDLAAREKARFEAFVKSVKLK